MPFSAEDRDPCDNQVVNILMGVEDPSALAGTERSVVLATKALRASGHRVFLLHAAADIPADLADGDISLPELFDVSQFVERPSVRAAWVRLRHFLAENEIDVVHLHWLLRFAVLRRLVAHIPVVFTTHVVLCPNGARYLWNERRACDRKIGLGCLTVGYRTKGCGHLGNGQPLGLAGFSRGMALDRHTRSGIARSHRIVTPSRWMADYMAANGAESSKIRVVEPPLSDDLTAVDALPDSPPTLTFVGRLVDFKGADQLIRASALLNFDHRIVIIGHGPQSGLRRLADELGVTDRLLLTGSLPPSEVDDLRLRSSVVVVPSLWPETFGMVGSEALALGIPVVAYRGGGSPEWIKLGGCLAAGVDAGDIRSLARELDRFVRDPPSTQERQAVASTVRTALQVDRHANRLLAVYHEAVADSGEARHVRV